MAFKRQGGAREPFSSVPVQSQKDLGKEEFFSLGHSASPKKTFSGQEDKAGIATGCPKAEGGPEIHPSSPTISPTGHLQSPTLLLPFFSINFSVPCHCFAPELRQALPSFHPQVNHFSALPQIGFSTFKNPCPF